MQPALGSNHAGENLSAANADVNANLNLRGAHRDHDRIETLTIYSEKYYVACGIQ